MGKPFKLVTYNIWAGKYLKKVISFLKKQNPDMLCLQEVGINNPYHPELSAVNVLDELHRAFPRMHFIYAPIAQRKIKGREQSFGNVIFSKKPFIRHRAHYFHKQPDWTERHDDQARNLLEAVIAIDGKELTILTTHLTYAHGFQDSPRQLKEAKKISRIVGTRKNVILAGDINSSPDTQVLRIIKQKLPNDDCSMENTFARHPFNTAGFSVQGLQYKIDHVLTTTDMRFVDVSVPNIDASDHLPIITTIEFR